MVCLPGPPNGSPTGYWAVTAAAGPPSRRARMRIAKRVVDALQPGQFVWQDGFGCKATASGTKIYLLQYRVGRRRRRITIGQHGRPWTPDSAKNEATRLLGLIAAGHDPLAAKQAMQTAPTV